MGQLTSTMQTIIHQGKEIFLLDYSGVDLLDLANEVRANDLWLSQNASSLKNTLFLTDVSRCHIDMDAIKAFQATLKATKQYAKGSAVVGVTGHRKVLLDTVSRFASFYVKTFNSQEEAKDWLANL